MKFSGIQRITISHILILLNTVFRHRGKNHPRHNMGFFSAIIILFHFAIIMDFYCAINSLALTPSPTAISTTTPMVYMLMVPMATMAPLQSPTLTYIIIHMVSLGIAPLVPSPSPKVTSLITLNWVSQLLAFYLWRIAI